MITFRNFILAEILGFLLRSEERIIDLKERIIDLMDLDKEDQEKWKKIKQERCYHD